MLVTEPALQGPIGRLVVGVCAVIAAFVTRHVGVVGVDDRAAAGFDVAVVGAVDGPFAPGRAFEARGFEAVFDAWRGEDEVLVREVLGQAVRFDVA